MPIRSKDEIVRKFVSYSGLIIELVSGRSGLLEINFRKDKRKLNADEIISDPLKKAILFLEDYFHGKKSDIEIVFISSENNCKEIESLSENNSGKLYLDMHDYTENEIRIYMELIKVGPGRTISYGELALRSGFAGGARFAGNCMAGNRFPIIIPCHRVIKSDGSIGNYSGGVGIKEFLLKHEAEKN